MGAPALDICVKCGRATPGALMPFQLVEWRHAEEFQPANTWHLCSAACVMALGQQLDRQRQAETTWKER